ncbi:MAG: type IX secretion system protein PorQ [Muribaculaceae bacterium]|nr:type IX secretion system protein PorQ [Muribaculaceae bacterium]
MKLLKPTLLSLLLLPAAMIAQDGTTAYNFMNITSSARIFGLGGVNITTVEDNITTVDQNPGLLGPEMSNQIAVNYMRYVGESNFAGVTYSHAAGERGAWQASIQYFGYGSMTHTDETGAVLGDFSPQDLSFAAGYTRDLADKLRGGFKVKMLYSNYEQYNAMALATDLGINYYDPDKDLSLSFVVANLGGQIKKFNESYDRLPIDVRLGWAQSFGTLPIRFSVTAWNLTKWHLPYYHTGDGSTDDAPELKDSFSSNLFRHLVFGADFIPSDKFYVSLAYNNKTRTDMSTYSRSFLSGWSLGAGLNVKSFNVGMAFAQPHKSATTFMLNITLNINDFLN